MNITLIGMAGAGKSVVGQELARRRSAYFLDIDQVLVERHNLPLQAVLDSLGEEAFLEKESALFIEAVTHADNTVLSPGGSLVYSLPAIAAARAHSLVVALDVPFEIIEGRVDVSSRGIIGMENKTLKEVYNDRKERYLQCAHVTVSSSNAPLGEVVDRIEELIALYKNNTVV
jgi:shikimate kinase